MKNKYDLLLLGCLVLALASCGRRETDTQPEATGAKKSRTDRGAEPKPTEKIPVASMAKVVVHGRQKSFGEKTLNGKTRHFVMLDLDKGLTIQAWASQDLHAAYRKSHQEKVAAMKAKLGQLEKDALEKAGKKTLNDKDLEQLKKDADKVGQEFDRAIEDMDFYIAEGSLRFLPQGKSPLFADESIQIDGTVGPHTPGGTHGGLARGRAIVEGQALPGKYPLGGDEHSPLAIENGQAPILVTGLLAHQNAKAEDLVRVTGKLVLGANRAIVLQAGQ